MIINERIHLCNSAWFAVLRDERTAVSVQACRRGPGTQIYPKALLQAGSYPIAAGGDIDSKPESPGGKSSELMILISGGNIIQNWGL
jgi:hypothetical protein